LDPSNQDRFRDRFTLAGAKDDSRDAEVDSQPRISFRKTSLFIFRKIIKRISHARRAYDAPQPLFPGYLLSSVRRVCTGGPSWAPLAFARWCSGRPYAWLPADPKFIAKFVDDQVERHGLSTIKRRLCAIAFAHRVSDLPTPSEHNTVRLAIRRAAR
jgi:hypothetical protein